MAVVVFFVASLMMSDVAKLLVGIVVGVVVYTLLCIVFNINDSKSIIKKLTKR